MSKLTAETFWQAHLRLLAGCLLAWFVVSFGCGILLVDVLNAYSIGNVPLGFWFAQQGAIYAFGIITVFYTWRVGKLEQCLIAAGSGSNDDPTAGPEERS